MVGGEGVAEVEDGDQQAKELPQCDHQGNGEGGGGGRQREHCPNAPISARREGRGQENHTVCMRVGNLNDTEFI